MEKTPPPFFTMDELQAIMTPLLTGLDYAKFSTLPPIHYTSVLESLILKFVYSEAYSLPRRGLSPAVFEF